MAFDKKEIALGIAGILASAAVAFLIYRLQQSDAAQNAANAANVAAEDESELANQQQEVASLPDVSVPAISSTPSNSSSTDDTDSTTPATDSDLEAIIAAFQGSDNSSVTNATTPIATVTQLPIESQPIIAPVTVPTLINFSASNDPATTTNVPLNTNLRAS